MAVYVRGEYCQVWGRGLAYLVPQVMAKSCPVQEVIDLGNRVDAALLPICRHFEADAGRYIGSGILVCKDPDTGVRNLSYHRMQLKGPAKFGASLPSPPPILDHLHPLAPPAK